MAGETVARKTVVEKAGSGIVELGKSGLGKAASALVGILLLSPALQAGSLDVSVEVPRLQVAEYHRPYIAIWLENDRNEATQLAVWYDVGMKDNGGLEWLKDMRQWWRRGGRALEMPMDGVSGATRAPGVHTLSFSTDDAPLSTLPPGDYRLRIEAAREVGGRELLEIPFSWPLRQELTSEIGGNDELGRISLSIKP